MLEASIGKFTYDSANRLTVAGTRYYVYDVEGTRIKTQKGEDTTKFVYNVNARLSQLLIKTENNADTKYVYGLGLIGEETSGNFKTYHFDYRGSTVAITNANGTVTDTFEYDTYGRLKDRTGTTKTPFLYNGRDGVITEDDTGLIYMRARYYSPELRRFINADKVHGDITNALTLNRYAYCNGDPANGVDPMGLSKERGGGQVQNINRTYHDYGKLYPLLMLEVPTHYSNVANETHNSGDKTGLVNIYRLLYKLQKAFSNSPYKNAESNYEYNTSLKAEALFNKPYGYLNGQEVCIGSKYKIGSSTISDTGCEALAAYNALYSLGTTDVKLSEVIYIMEQNGVLVNKGKYGGNPYSLDRVLAEYDVNSEFVDIDECTKQGTYIFSYVNQDLSDGTKTKSVHTVASYYDGDTYFVYNDENNSLAVAEYENIYDVAHNYICGLYLTR